jgi:hypothetical protein
MLPVSWKVDERRAHRDLAEKPGRRIPDRDVTANQRKLQYDAVAATDL